MSPASVMETRGGGVSEGKEVTFVGEMKRMQAP